MGVDGEFYGGVLRWTCVGKIQGREVKVLVILLSVTNDIWNTNEGQAQLFFIATSIMSISQLSTSLNSTTARLARRGTLIIETTMMSNSSGIPQRIRSSGITRKDKTRSVTTTTPTSIHLSPPRTQSPHD